MREDPSKSKEFLNSEIWDRQRYDEKFLIPPDEFDFDEDDPRRKRKFVSNSLSGNERNRLFLRSGESFTDVSLLSGTDDLADARSFSLIDYDNDGWTDIALMSLNKPRFKLFRNQFGKIYPNNKLLRLRLVGGHDSDQPSQSKLSNRDAIGTRVLVTYESGKSAAFQKQAGEGFGSQNSATMKIGCGEDDNISKLEIRWPSGQIKMIEKPDLAKVLTVNEVE